ncbi:MAG: glycosyltransferase family 39 protein [Candidatus Acidiferrales bacterium]
MENSDGTHSRAELEPDGKRSHLYLVVLVFAAIIYLGCIISPPSLMDDVDAVQAQVARNMITSGDWVTGHLDGVVYLDRAPLLYWIIAGSYKVFGPFDWAARIPLALFAIALCVLTAAFGMWAFGKRAGFYAGLCMSTCIGLFLFTRILNPDIILTFTVALSMWAFLRALDEEEPHPRLWAAVLAASIAAGLLLKSLISLIFPVGTGLLYLFLTRQLFSPAAWKRLRPFSGLAIILLIAAPWHILATLRNPPYFDFTRMGGPGQYHGFLWFFFYNEQVLRFLNLRYPHDYNTVPRLWFWLLHLVWLFPWSVYFPAVAKLSFKPVDRAGRTRLLALCWVGFVLVFFTFSTTQEYYSMPAYPAFALLLGSAMAMGGDWVRWGTRALSMIAGIAAIAAFAILFHVRGLPTPGDISAALTRHPKAYTLSLGHMLDLTLDSFAYLRTPLAVAGVAFLIGAVGCLRAVGQRAFLAAALMMVLFFHAARIAMVAFDPYLSSRPLAQALMQAPEGKLIAQGHYYEFSSVFFYTNRTGLLITDRRMNLEYGSYAPGAPSVFIDEATLKDLWLAPDRYYLLTFQRDLPRYEQLVGTPHLQTIATSGGKVLLTNQPVGGAQHLTPSRLLPN